MWTGLRWARRSSEARAGHETPTAFHVRGGLRGQLHFDAVARAVAAGASRRQVLRLLAIGTVTAWLPGRAGAAPARQDCAGMGLTDCGGVCVDISSDPFNCGGCGLACESGVCEGGGCSPLQVNIGCVSPLVDCGGGGCVDLSSDPFNCGGCGVVCEGCAGGDLPLRSVSAASSPLVECAGLCADLNSDPTTVERVATSARAASVEEGSATRSAAPRASPSARRSAPAMTSPRTSPTAAPATSPVRAVAPLLTSALMVSVWRPAAPNPSSTAPASASTSASTRTTAARVAPSARRRL